MTVVPTEDLFFCLFAVSASEGPAWLRGLQIVWQCWLTCHKQTRLFEALKVVKYASAELEIIHPQLLPRLLTCCRLRAVDCNTLSCADQVIPIKTHSCCSPTWDRTRQEPQSREGVRCVGRSLFRCRYSV